MEQPFANPFAEDGHNNSDQPGPSPPAHSPTEHLAPEQTTPAAPLREPSPAPSSSGKKTNPESGSGDDDISQHEGVIEKLKSATDDAETAIVDKIKDTAHKLHLHSVRATGVTRLLNPTTIRMQARFGSGPSQEDSHGLQKAKEMALLWRSRDNRKGRNSIAVPMMPPVESEQTPLLPLRYTPRLSAKISDIGNILWRMCTVFPYWDMAFWSGWSYTIGSALFVADGALAWGPVAFGESFESASAEKYGGPLCFFFGALFYQVGAVAAYLEAVNDGSFHGSAMRRLLEGHGDEVNKKLLDDKLHNFVSHIKPHHRDRDAEAFANSVDPEAGWNTKEHRHLRPGSIYPTGKAPAPRRGGVDLGGEEGDTSTYATWRWWPTWHALRTYHAFEIGYIACTIQLFGVTLYGITAIVILPGILDSLNSWQELGAYWVPQIVAAACFLIASIMFTLETQEKWWKPEPKVLGWWIGVWSIIGSVGFELCAAFGVPSGNLHWASYQSDLSSMWGSAAYLIGSFLQWYEALSKNPIEELFSEPGEMKSYQVHPI